jgi:hypothetical protein
MKKLGIAIIGIFILASFPAAAYSDFSIGVGAGTATFVTTRTNLSHATSIIINIGFGYWGTDTLYLRPQLQFYKTQRNYVIDRKDFYPYLGIAVPLGLVSNLDLTLSGILGLSYYINNGPVELYIEALPGLDIVQKGEFDLGMGMGVNIGARYTF